MARITNNGLGCVFAMVVSGGIALFSLKSAFDGFAGGDNFPQENTVYTQGQGVGDQIMHDIENMDDTSKIVLGGVGTIVFGGLAIGMGVMAKDEFDL